MMNALLIDSDLEALLALERLLRRDERFSTIHCCADPGAAWAQLRRCRPDVVFLDTRFAAPVASAAGKPDRRLDGIALACRIRRSFDRIRLVFVSSDAGQALAAFQAFPVAFLLKPVRASTLQPVLERLFLDRDLEPAAEPASVQPRPKVHALRCFGDYSIVNPADRTVLKLPTRLCRDLLACLVTHHDRTLTRSALMGHLLPERCDSQAVNLMHVSFYRLRRFIDQNQRLLPGLAVCGHYRLTVPEGVCDAVDFARYVSRSEPLTETGIARAEAVAALYRGPLFADEDYPWADDLRTELEVAHERLLLQIAEFRWSHDEPALSERALRTLVQANPLSEEGHCALLDLFLARNERRKFICGFETYRRIMHDELAVDVDRHYLNAYQRLRLS